MSRWQALVCTAVFGFACAAFAQSYPVRTIRIMVPLAPGASADIDSRLVGDKLSQAFGQPVVIRTGPVAEAPSASMPSPRRRRTVTPSASVRPAPSR